MIGLVCFCIIGLLIYIFAHIRNYWVYNRIKEVLFSSDDAKKNLKEYDRLPNYFFMFYHFWVWDIEKFKDMNKKSLFDREIDEEIENLGKK